jgi:hypothetical protein
MLREEILTSEPVNELSPELLTTSGDAKQIPHLLGPAVYPLKPDPYNDGKSESTGLIHVYEVAGKRYRR